MIREVSAQELEAACRKCVRAQVTNVQALVWVLDRQKMEYSVVDDTSVDIYGTVNISQLVEELGKEQCQLLSLKERDESLESYYINLVGGERNE